MDVAAIRDRLKVEAKTVSVGARGAKLRAYDTIPARIDGPCVIFAPGDPFVEYNHALAGGLAVLNFDAVLLASTANDWDRAQTAIDNLISAGAAGTSLYDALSGSTLNGLCDHVYIEDARAMGVLNLGPSQSAYATGRLILTVRARRA